MLFLCFSSPPPRVYENRRMIYIYCSKVLRLEVCGERKGRERELDLILCSAENSLLIFLIQADKRNSFNTRILYFLASQKCPRKYLSGKLSTNHHTYADNSTHQSPTIKELFHLIPGVSFSCRDFINLQSSHTHTHAHLYPASIGPTTKPVCGADVACTQHVSYPSRNPESRYTKVHSPTQRGIYQSPRG